MTSLNLPDKTLQFVKDHPLMDDSVTPVGDRPRLVKRDVKYTQIVVDRVRALNGTIYDVMFISTGKFFIILFLIMYLFFRQKCALMETQNIYIFMVFLQYVVFS